MKYYDLFCGIGGFHLGMQKAGHECIGSCEIDNDARKIYKKNYGNYPTESDSTKIDPGKLKDFDILCGGFSCQPFSLCGERKGFTDERGNRFFDIVRIAQRKKPKIIFMENVKGLLYNNGGRTFSQILTTLSDMGYGSIEWECIDGSAFLPQHRERVFIIAHYGKECARPIFPLQKNRDKCAQTQIKQIKKSIDDSYRIYSTDGIARTLRATAGGMGAKTGLYAMAYVSNTNSNMKNRVQIRDKTWALTNSSNDFSILQGKRLRRLMPIECERLMGFPDNFTEGVSETARYRLIGNAVMVPIIEELGKQIGRT